MNGPDTSILELHTLGIDQSMLEDMTPQQEKDFIRAYTRNRIKLQQAAAEGEVNLENTDLGTDVTQLKAKKIRRSFSSSEGPIKKRLLGVR